MAEISAFLPKQFSHAGSIAFLICPLVSRSTSLVQADVSLTIGQIWMNLNHLCDPLIFPLMLP